MTTQSSLCFAFIVYLYWLTTYVLASQSDNSWGSNAAGYFIIIIIGIGVIRVIREIAKQNRNSIIERQRLDAIEQHRLDAIEQLVQSHESTLYAKKLQTVKRDAYGNVFDDEWQREKVYFHDYVVKPKLGITRNLDGTDPYPYEDSPTSDIIEKVVDDFSRSSPTQDFDVSSLSPYEFEAFCTQLLNDSGWSARTTQGSGDQGIDIIGEKDGLRAVFQVKQYSSPVGNKAVQEAISGKAFASADLAFVVSNASYTPSAIKLADVSGVKLLHYSELNGLEVSR